VSAPDRPGGDLTGAEARRLRTSCLRLRSALFDRITGLGAYHAHLDRIETLADGRRLGVVMLEFPGLGEMEAAHGWEVGDRLLAGVASCLKALRGRGLPSSAVVTLDGVHSNAFPIFLWESAGGGDLDAAALAAIADELGRVMTARLASAPWAPSPPIDFSVGYALVCLQPTVRFERLVHQGIREARGMTLRAAERIEYERALELRAILREERLTTMYQPIVDMDRGLIMGYEALTRGPENTHFAGPKALFSCSHGARLSDELDRVCRRRAVQNARGFDPLKKLFLNSLPESLGSPGFLDPALQSVLDAAALHPRNLVLEITERTAIHDFEVFGRELERLRRQGFLVAIDDVGTGYSSLQTVSEVQADYLKIDMSLIKNIHQSLIKQDLVHSLLQVASRTATKVVAEGIETEEEYRTLRACGVHFGQGFYLAPPGPPFPTEVRGAAGPPRGGRDPRAFGPAGDAHGTLVR
jgi:EAL domain-containing protein (putative c-di-GMP-specific phosphodiesterase class I)/GGDEF domain-containing protein